MTTEVDDLSVTQSAAAPVLSIVIVSWNEWPKLQLCLHSIYRSTLPETEILEFCKVNGVVMLAFAPLGHGMEPRITDDAVITGIAQRVGKTPAQVALAWAAQRGTAFLTTSTNPAHIDENFAIDSLPDEAMRQMKEDISTAVRLNAVVETGVPGFVPRRK